MIYNYELIANKDITVERLAQVLEAANITHEIDEEGDLTVTHDGLHFFIFLVNDKSLKFSARFTFTEEATDLQKLELCNRCNDGYMYPRFSYGENKMIVDYFLNIEDSLLVELLISSIKRYTDATFSILSDANTEDILT